MHRLIRPEIDNKVTIFNLNRIKYIITLVSHISEGLIIKTNSPIDTINYSDKEHISIKSGGQEYLCKYAIVTVSVGVL